MFFFVLHWLRWLPKCLASHAVLSYQRPMRRVSWCCSFSGSSTLWGMFSHIRMAGLVPLKDWETGVQVGWWQDIGPTTLEEGLEVDFWPWQEVEGEIVPLAWHRHPEGTGGLGCLEEVRSCGTGSCGWTGMGEGWKGGRKSTTGTTGRGTTRSITWRWCWEGTIGGTMGGWGEPGQGGEEEGAPMQLPHWVGKCCESFC